MPIGILWADIVRVATPIEPHDPSQPAREVPDLGLTDAAMRAIVTTATERLSVVAVAWTPSLLDLAQPFGSNSAFNDLGGEISERIAILPERRVTTV